jgi:hypothetical protein
MSIFKIFISAAGLLALISSPASADSIRYAGGPKTGQTFVQRDQAALGNPFDARAEIALPQQVQQSHPKGGIASRGP